MKTASGIMQDSIPRSIKAKVNLTLNPLSEFLMNLNYFHASVNVKQGGRTIRMLSVFLFIYQDEQQHRLE